MLKVTGVRKEIEVKAVEHVLIYAAQDLMKDCLTSGVALEKCFISWRGLRKPSFVLITPSTLICKVCHLHVSYVAKELFSLCKSEP